ncbi:MAG: ZIP family metal transporter [bacterium]|nr:ZIP family metal transporter [bacterium]
MVYLFGLLAIVFTFLGGLFALRFKDKMHLIVGFSAGAVIGLAFFDLIPESFEILGQNFGISNVCFFIILGFIIYMILDRFFMPHQHGHGEHEETLSTHKRPIFLSAGSLSLHSFLDGLIIGLSFQVSFSIGLVVALAVLAHDFSDGINTVNFVLKNGGNRRSVLKWLTVDSLAPFLGVVVGSTLTLSENVLGIIISIFAGFFLYIGASELLPESYHDHPTWWTTVATIFGVLFLFAITKLASGF